MSREHITDDILDKSYKVLAILHVCRQAMDEWPSDGNTCPRAGDIRLVLEIAEDFAGEIHNAMECGHSYGGANG